MLVHRSCAARRRAATLLVPALLALTGLALAAVPALAQTVSVVASLPTTIQGAQSGLTLGDDGFLYGTAYATGSIYKVQPDGTAFEIIHTFSTPVNTINADGQYPARELVAPGDGFLYGTCTNGGANGLGTVYRVSLDGTTFQTLHSFSAENSQFDNADGANPLSGLAVNGDGYFYGTTNAGGPNAEGVVYRLSADGTTYQTLHAFTFGNTTDGDNAYAGLLWGGDGYFYGTTKSGGASFNGTVYRLTPAGTGFSLLHSFSSAEGGSFANVMAGLDNRLYGVSFQGGANLAGLVWGLNRDGANFTDIHVFSSDSSGSNADGSGPYGALAVGPDGTLYGATENGGAHNLGVVFHVNTDGTGFTALDSLGSATGDPSGPVGSLERIGSVIYGTSPFGGASGFGAVFQIANLPGTAVTTTTVLVSSLNPSTAGQSVTFTATVIPAGGSGNSSALTGTVQFAVDGTNAGSSVTLNSNGNATFTTAGLTAGMHTLTAAYTPTGAFAASEGSLTQTVNAATTHAQLLWNNVSGQAALWSINPDGSYASAAYGPFSGWTARAVSEAPDGADWLLWTNTSGEVSLWRVSALTPNGYTTVQYGPYANFAAVSLSIGADGNPRLLWNETNGTASLWDIDKSTGAFTHAEYGPYAGWTANQVASGPDVTDLLWTNTNGTAAGWRINNANGALTTSAFGPFSGYSAVGLSVGPDDGAHLLWDSTSGSEALWSADFTTGAFTATSYGPISGWATRAIATGPDNGTRMLWDNTSGEASLWDIVGSNYTHTEYGPFSGWTAVAVSAGP